MIGNERKEKDNAIETKKSEMVAGIIKILVDGNLTVDKVDVIDNLKTAIQKITVCKDFLYESGELFDDEVFNKIKQIKEEVSRLELRNHLTKIGI